MTLFENSGTHTAAASGGDGLPPASQKEARAAHLSDGAHAVAKNAIGAAYLFSAARRSWNAASFGARDADCGYGLPSVAKAGGPDPAAVIGRGKDGASFAERMRVGLPVVGLAVAGVAATGLATGVAAPVTSFSMFLMLLGGLSLVTIHVLRA